MTCNRCFTEYTPEEFYEDCPVCYPLQGVDLTRDRALVDSLCAAADSQAPVANDAVPVRIDEVPTKRMLAIPSNRELMAHLAQRAEAGQGDDL